ncbi:hypothetical protein [Faucicola boevrei]|uniref:hypothetical protein n=1 Tax=Faucicola boevrei TaxID=346665 RepID=UPI0012EA5D08|nr:hypothetical protein [Moraxella boevrei]
MNNILKKYKTSLKKCTNFQNILLKLKVMRPKPKKNPEKISRERAEILAQILKEKYGLMKVVLA